MAGDDDDRTERTDDDAQRIADLGGGSEDPFGLRPTDEYGKHWARVMGALSSPDRATRDRAAFAIAEEVRRNPHRVKAAYIPTRPESLGTDDEILAEFLDQKKPAANTPRARMRALFGAWRAAVWKAEAANAANIVTIVRAIHTFRRLNLETYAAQLERYLEDEYDLRARVPDDAGDVEPFASRLAERRDVLSWELRGLRRRPRSFATSSPDDDETVWKQGTLPTIPSPDDFEPPF